jgi:cyanuric acid amidohydrolase
VYEAGVYTVPVASPDDVRPVAHLFDTGVVDPSDVVGIIAQTEGDGFARGYASLRLQLLFAQRLGRSESEIAARLPMLMIGGTAGLMCPHVTLFVKKSVSHQGNRDVARLAIGVAQTRDLLPEEYGTAAQIELVAAAVREAMATAEIASAADVACVELKCPQMTGQRMADAQSRGKTPVSSNPMTASSMSRGASALGAALALGEISPDVVTDAIVGTRSDLFTTKGSASSGSEQTAVRVIVLGNVRGLPGGFVAGHGMMTHQLDLAGARLAFTGAGLRLEDGMVCADDRRKLAAVFVNAGANVLPHCGGRRHTMGSDFLNGFAGHVSKAVVHANVAAIAQDTLVLASAGAEHQGAPGSNLVCVIANHGPIAAAGPAR